MLRLYNTFNDISVNKYMHEIFTRMKINYKQQPFAKQRKFTLQYNLMHRHYNPLLTFQKHNKFLRLIITHMLNLYSRTILKKVKNEIPKSVMTFK